MDAKYTYDSTSATVTLTFKQRTPSTPGQPETSKLPVVIPVLVGLLSRASGKEILSTQMLKFTEAEQSFTLSGVSEEPVVSLLRDFSAPVRLNFPQTDEDLAFLMSYDTDAFNRWDAANRLSTKVILSLASLPLAEVDTAEVPPFYLEALRKVIEQAKVSERLR